MTDIDFFDLVNSLLRAAVTVLLVCKLVNFYDLFKVSERLGMGLIAGSSLMTIPTIWADTPGYGAFDGWSTTIMTFGVLLYFAGRMMRHLDHKRRNDQMRMYRKP